MMQKPPLSIQLQMETRLRIYLHIRAHNSSIIPMDRRWKHSKSPMRMLEAKVHRRSTEHAPTSSYSVDELRNANHKKTQMPWFYIYQAPDVSKSTERRTAVVPGAAGRRTGRVAASRHRKNPADCLPSNAEWLRWEPKRGLSAEEHGLLSWATCRGLLAPAWQLTTICGSSSRESRGLLTQSSGTRHTSSAQTHLQAKQPTHEIN